MNEIVIGILALFMLVVIGILRAILTQPADAKRSGRSPRWTPQRREGSAAATEGDAITARAVTVTA